MTQDSPTSLPMIPGAPWASATALPPYLGPVEDGRDGEHGDDEQDL